MICNGAVKFEIFPPNFPEPKEVIIPCHRHGDAFLILKELGFSRHHYRELCQGFLNENGEFLNRGEAYQEAVRCHQFTGRYIEEHYGELNPPRILFTEDLW